MEKEHLTIHVVEVGNYDYSERYPKHPGFFYELRPERMHAKPLDKVFTRRCHATRYANRIAYKIQQWYAA